MAGQSSISTACLATGATLALIMLYVVARRRRVAPGKPRATITLSESIQEALAKAEASWSVQDSSPIQRKLVKLLPHETPHMRLQMRQPAEFEALDTRVTQKDVAKGCIDPDRIGVARDFCDIVVRRASDRNCAGAELLLQLPAFMAHLANPLALIEPELDESILSPLWSDGTWTGTIMWDSAVHTAEMLLADEAWASRLRGASVCELGCGLGLPALVAHLLGASNVVLTDREMVVRLVGDGLECNGRALEGCRAVVFPWSDDAAAALREQHFAAAAPDVIIACDCIFAPIFGDSFLLLRMLIALASSRTLCIVALERRPNDGAEAFFEQAVAAGFDVAVCMRRERVVVCQMRRVA